MEVAWAIAESLDTSTPVSVPDPIAQPLAQAERQQVDEEVILEDTGSIPNATEDELNSDTSEPSESDSNVRMMTKEWIAVTRSKGFKCRQH
jgi:hypothetical protein